MRTIRTIPLFVLLWFTPAWASEAAHGEVAWMDMGFHLINLLILIGVLYYFLRSPLRNFIKERSERLEGEIKEAGERRRNAEEELAQSKKRLEKVEMDIKSLEEKAVKRANEERDRIIREAELSARRMKEDARLRIDYMVRKAKRDLRVEAIRLATGLAEEDLYRYIRTGDEERLSRDFLTKLEELQPGSDSSRENQHSNSGSVL